MAIHDHVPDIPRPVPEMRYGRHGTGCPLSCVIVVCINHDIKQHIGIYLGVNVTAKTMPC